MRHGRAKAARKTLQFFERTLFSGSNSGSSNGGSINKKEPYHIVVDGTFIVALFTNKIQNEIFNRMDTLLQHHSIQFYWTQTTQKELQLLVEHCNDPTIQKKVLNQNNKKRKPLLSNPNEHHHHNKNSEINLEERKIMLENALQWGNDHCELIHMVVNNQKSSSSSGGTTTTSTTVVVEKDDVVELYPTQEQCTEVLNIPMDTWETLSNAAIDMARLILSTIVVSSTSQTNTTTTTTAISTNSSSSYHSQRYYFCASQDDELLNVLRYTGRVPIIRLARGSVLLLEQPSKYAQQLSQQKERIKWKQQGSGSSIVGQNDNTMENRIEQMELLQKIQKEEKVKDSEQSLQRKDPIAYKYHQQQKNSMYDNRKKKKVTKGPNPLSCKKKKKISIILNKQLPTSKQSSSTK